MSKKSYPVSDTCEMIKKGRFNAAEKELVVKITKNPEDIASRKELAFLYFMTENYSAAERFIRSVINLDPDVFRDINNNTEFDLYYIFLTSMIRQNKLNSVIDYFTYTTDFESLSNENLTKYELAWIEYEYRSRDFENIDSRIESLFNSNSISENQKLNLYYILAVSKINLNDVDSALDNAIFLILNDEDYRYTRKTKRLLDGIVNNAGEQTLDRMKDKIADAYRELAVRCEDNSNLKDKILMAINTLENSAVTIEMKTPQTENSYISRIRLFTDRDVTSVYLTSSDSIYYQNPPLYDGKTLTLLIPDKRINSPVNFSRSLPGSGIESIEWASKNDTLEFKVNLSSNLNLTIEKSSGESFERYDKIADRFSLKINVHLPEQTLDRGVEKFDLQSDRYTIVLDPGHGGDDPGAISELKKSNGERYTEKEINLYTCKILKEKLENEGYRVFLTRDGDYYPSLHERNRIAQNRNADLFISLHFNSASVINKRYWQTERYYGSELIVRESIGIMPDFINFQTSNLNDWRRQREKALSQHRKFSEILARTIPGSLHSPFNNKRNLVKRNLTIFSGMTIPHALIEAGFLINNKNLEYFLTEKGQHALFEGVLKGIQEYRGSSY
ncbi:MAG: N-acetylmuramoyl-L-alanine amidase [Candidatus Delongbacteria bacterium]